MSSRLQRSEDREAGQVGGIKVLPLAVLVFVVGTLLVANAWAVVDAKLVAGTAEREAARTFAEAAGDGGDAAAWALADRAAGDAFSAGGKRPERASIEIAQGGRLLRCERIVVRASYRVPALTVPWIGGFGAGIEVAARHGELVDPYRSGLDGPGCV